MAVSDRPSEFPISTADELIREKARDNGEADFVFEGDATASFGGIDRESDAVARTLHSHWDVDKGDIVAGVMGNSIDHIRAWFACLKLGAVWSPLDTHLDRRDMSDSLHDVQPAAIVVGRRSAGVYEEIRDRFEFPELSMDEVAWANDLSFHRTGAEDPPQSSVVPSDPAGIVFTGGTTGTPKPIVLPHFSLVAGAYRYRDAFDPAPTDRHLTVLRLYHAGGQGFGVLGPLLSDISTVIRRGFDPETFIESVNDVGATIADPTGGMWGELVAAHDEPVENTLRIVDGAIPARYLERVQELFDFEIIEPYGQTEAGGILCTHNRIPDASTVETDDGKPVGPANDWIDIRIVDDADEPTPTGVTGEICLRPKIPHTFMIEYRNAPEATVDVWDNLWLHTGDRGFLDSDGMLHFVGRKAHFLRKMGENISVEEIEQVIRAMPEVADVAVVGVPDPTRGDESIKACVVTETDIRPEEIVDRCRSSIADFKRPRFVEFLDELPRNETKNSVERETLRDRGIGQAWDRLDE